MWGNRPAKWDRQCLDMPFFHLDQFSQSYTAIVHFLYKYLEGIALIWLYSLWMSPLDALSSITER